MYYAKYHRVNTVAACLPQTPTVVKGWDVVAEAVGKGGVVQL